MNLDDLAQAYQQLLKPLNSLPKKAFHSVEFDSRHCQKGSLFVAIEGMTTNGHHYIDAAIQNGADMVIIQSTYTETSSELINKHPGISFLSADNTRLALSAISEAFYGEPTKLLKIFGVTGTNGKTTITYILDSVFKACGFTTGLIGTISHQLKGIPIPSNNTTPESRDLSHFFSRMAEEKISHVSMEISSHALSLDRVASINLDAAIITNITEDHLDYHETLEDYYLAKEKVIELLSKSKKPRTVLIANYDIPYYSRLKAKADLLHIPTLSYSLNNEKADFYVSHYSLDNHLSKFSVKYYGVENQYDSNLSGKFNIYNVLACICLFDWLGVDQKIVRETLISIRVPGRLQRVENKFGFSIYVDYAHTPDALENVLSTLKEMSHARLLCIFGCGGDRDKTKRPLMAKAVEQYADIAILTSDNPRTEDPESILNDAQSGFSSSAKYYRISDRKEAIVKAVQLAEPGDILLIAGKGHEDYQIIGNVKHHFDDREVAKEALNDRN